MDFYCCSSIFSSKIRLTFNLFVIPQKKKPSNCNGCRIFCI
nr:MAG TPA: hypothetical protein [Caudoviricetes sp.]